MKTLVILKTEPDDKTKALVPALAGSEEGEAALFRLYEEPTDYEKLLDLIFECEKVISLW
jgi:hypothetical protein